MGTLAELHVADLVPYVLNTKALPDHSQQCFWCCSQASDEQVLAELPFAFARGRVGYHLDDTGEVRPVRLEVLVSFLCHRHPDSVTTMALLEILCHKWHVTCSLKLAGHLTTQGALVVLNRQARVGSLGVDAVFYAGVAPSKNACVVCSASAWMPPPPQAPGRSATPPVSGKLSPL
jgi:hypothetical protein